MLKSGIPYEIDLKVLWAKSDIYYKPNQIIRSRLTKSKVKLLSENEGVCNSYFHC